MIAFFRQFAIGAACCVVALCLLVFLADPYGVFASSPRWGHGRLRMLGGWAQEMRYVVPQLAKRAEFDSAIFGNSTCQVFAPASLDRAFGGRFVNLCMAGGPFDEISLVFRAFASHHAEPRTVVWVAYLDICMPGAQSGFNPSVPFPAPLYVPTVTNLRLLFDEEIVRQAALKLVGSHGDSFAPQPGLPESYYRNGDWNLYAGSDFTPPAVRGRIYSEQAAGNRTVFEFADPQPFAPVTRLTAMLGALPASTRKIVLFVPMHQTIMPRPGSLTARRLSRCRELLADMARDLPNARFFDFFGAPDIVGDDSKFYDAIHLLRPATDAMLESVAGQVTSLQ